MCCNFQKKPYVPDTFGDGLIQFSADNVDHNLLTLNSNGMGIVASITPAVEFKEIIPRVEVTSEEIVVAGAIDIKYYKTPNETSPFVAEN